MRASKRLDARRLQGVSVFHHLDRDGYKGVHGFSLVELFVVIGILAILAAIVLPAIQYAREASRRTQCKNNLRQVALATKMYHDARRHFPTAYFIICGGVGLDARAWSWLARILPYAGEEAHYQMAASR